MPKLSLSSPNMNISIWENQTEKHESRSGGIIIGPQPSSGILPILWEALKIAIQNGRVVASILLPVFIFHSLLAYVAYIDLVPISKDLLSKVALLRQDPEGWAKVDEATRRGIIKDVRRILVLKLVKWFFSCVIWVLFSVTTISLSSEAYAREKVSTKGLFSRIAGRWKRPLITGFYMALISNSLMLIFLMISIGLILVVADQGFALFFVIAASVILGSFCYLYVAAVWMLSLVVSILEEDSYGLKAIDRAGELMRGKRLKGCALNLLFVFASGTVYIASFVIMSKKSGSTIQMPLLVMIPQIFLMCLLEFFVFVMYTLFYHECKKCHEEAAGAKGGVGLYDPIASVEA